MGDPIMASIINASNSTGLTFTSDQSGVLQLQQNGVNLPALSVAPAFYAYSTGSVTYPAGADTKIPLNTESFDTNNNFDSTTNYRFTPTVAGYYQISACTNTTYATNNSSSYVNVQVRKNGSLWSIFGSLSCSNGNYTTISGATIVYLNGTTDYIELFLGTNNGGTVTAQSQGTTYGSYMCGCLIRGA